MVMGRPQEFDRNKVAQELIEWAKKPDSINLCKFCALHDPIISPSYLSIWAKEDDNFSKAYDAAKLFLGFRREEWLSQETLHVKAYDLNAKTYDYFLKEEHQQQAQNAVSLENQNITIKLVDARSNTSK
jgi:hypothetical protein